MITKLLDILNLILTLIKKYLDYKDKSNEEKFRDNIKSDTASIWLSSFGGQDKRNKANDTTTNVK